MSPRKGEKPFDAWSWVHLASGVGLGLVPFLQVAWSVGLLVVYELFEGGLRRLKTKKHDTGLFEYESWSNIGMDLVVGAAGILIGRAVLWTLQRLA